MKNFIFNLLIYILMLDFFKYFFTETIRQKNLDNFRELNFKEIYPTLKIQN